MGAGWMLETGWVLCSCIRGHLCHIKEALWSIRARAKHISYSAWACQYRRRKTLIINEFQLSWRIVSVSQGSRLQIRLRKKNSSIHYPETRVYFLNFDDYGLQRAYKIPRFSISDNKARKTVGGLDVRRRSRRLWYWPSAFLAVVSRIFLFTIAYRVN